MKSPDEIKKGLEICNSSPGYKDCKNCPYFEILACATELRFDTFDLVQQLQAENAEQAERIKHLEAELDAAVRDLKVLCGCMACDHAEKGPDSTPCNECTNCNGMVVESKWQWHGVQKEE